MVSQGLSDEQIARRTNTGVRTVGTQVREMRWKLGAENRAHAVKIGFETGLLRAENGDDMPAAGFTWNDIIATWHTLLEDVLKPRATTLKASEAYLHDMLLALPTARPTDYTSLNIGVQLWPDESLTYGAWQLLDQYGKVMREHGVRSE